jgi:hypothetical protein
MSADTISIKRVPRPFLLIVMAVSLVASACGKPPAPSSPTAPVATPTGRAGIAQAMAGTWVSLAPEIRPSKNPEGTIKPIFLTRNFVYSPGDKFQLTVMNFADPSGKVPIAKIEISGHMSWRGDHPIAAGAQKVDFVADEAYAVTPLVQGFVDLLNKLSLDGYAKWEVGQKQSIFGKSFPPFGLIAGKNFMEYDLVYIAHGMMFWGARNVDGRGFDTEDNRPTNLQIPLVRDEAH